MSEREITTPDGVAEAYLTGEQYGRASGVLLFMDAGGLRQRIRDMADEIAGWGYVVLAPNILYRSGTQSQISLSEPMVTKDARAQFFRRAMPRVRSLTPEKFARDLPAYVDVLRTCAREPFGVVGYCMGARFAMRAAAAYPNVIAACGGFHGGRLATEEPDSPHLLLPSATAEFVFGHGDRDDSMNAEAVERLGKALDDAGLRATNEVYAGALHGHSMSDMMLFDEAATKRHFAELRDLFARTLTRG